MHKTTRRFWNCFDELPTFAQSTARKNFELLKQNSARPSLHFKKVGKFWSIRAGRNYRALAFYDGEDFIWVWIRSHDEYCNGQGLVEIICFVLCISKPHIRTN